MAIILCMYWTDELASHRFYLGWCYLFMGLSADLLHESVHLAILSDTTLDWKRFQNLWTIPNLLMKTNNIYWLIRYSIRWQYGIYQKHDDFWCELWCWESCATVWPFPFFFLLFFFGIFNRYVYGLPSDNLLVYMEVMILYWIFIAAW